MRRPSPLSSLHIRLVLQPQRSCAAAYREKIAGAFLVAPPEVTNPKIRPKHLMTFGPLPRDPLPFPSLVVASRNDPFGTYEHAGDIANAWGSLLVDAGESGHINSESGHGPWPGRHHGLCPVSQPPSALIALQLGDILAVLPINGTFIVIGHDAGNDSGTAGT